MRQADATPLLSDSPFEDVAPHWSVEIEGHRWITHGRERLLTGGIHRGRNPELRRYPMSDVPGLFRTFVQLEPTEEAYLGFANRYGLLGLPHVQVQSRHPVVGERFTGVFGWRVTHLHMLAAVRLWDAIQDGDVRELLHSTPQGNCTAWVFRLDERGTFQSGPTGLHERHPFAAARRFIQSWINDALGQSRPDCKPEMHIGVRVLWHPDRRQYVPRVFPLTLFGLMWWQFARMFTGETRFGECHVCHRPIEYGPDGSFSTRMYCSSACKQKHHRKQVKEAKNLRAKKWSIPRIAKKLQTTPEAIQNWLTKKK